VATYAIGDVQGCHDALERLLRRIDFDPARDRIWLCGDLVNRGPDSAGVLRLAMALGEAVVAVLGNHDLHLLARAEGLRAPGKRDTVEDVLAAPDRDALLDYVAARPFLHREGGYLMVHAGLLPEWTAEDAEALAGEATAALRADRRAFLETIYGHRAPRRFSEGLDADDRLRCIVAALTRLRTVEEGGAMDLAFAGPPDAAPPSRRPWFDLRSARAPAGVTVLCGHWSALGLLVRDDVIALDTGCVWGGSLTALRLEDRAVFQVPAQP
jgi:bis(5'-nucleosyl)-tetraphosphatase (symmetrical)